MTAYWKKLFPEQELVVLYGGKKSDYDLLDWPLKSYINDPGLKTKDHQRERQTYWQVYSNCTQFVRPDHELVFFTEFDQIPSGADSLMRLCKIKEQEDSDVLCYNLMRVDDTNHPHYLYHLSQTDLLEQMRAISTRSDPSVVLSCSGFGQLWSRETFMKVASVKKTTRIYLELWFPTVAHHLGYRVRDVGNRENSYNLTSGEMTEDRKRMSAEGAIFVHPVKFLWSGDE